MTEGTNHPDYRDFNSTERSTRLSQTFAMWAIAWELRRIAEQMEQDHE